MSYLEPAESPYRVPFDASFRVADAPTNPTGANAEDGKKQHKRALRSIVEGIRTKQEAMYAEDRWSLLLIFQAMDAAGKDGTIEKVTRGVNPAGFQVSSFKKPSAEELDHDFLWRIARRTPERGRIGVFNRSHYEEVLAVKVHPEYLGGQNLPGSTPPETIFEERYASIREFERHLARSGTVILKFWLNVSHDEQRRRFLDRIDEPESRWKFNPGDVHERGFWNEYMSAYETALNETSRPWAPWYAIPADDKPFMRRTVAELVLRTMERMDPQYPTLSAEEEAELLRFRAALVDD